MARTEAEARKLFDGHVWIAERCARGFTKRLGARVEFAELKALALGGLWNAALRWEAAFPGARFVYYAKVRVRGAVRDGLREMDFFPRRATGAQRTRRIVSDRALNCLQSAEPNAAERLDALAIDRELRHAVGQLPDRQRAIITRHYFGAERLDALAAELGVTPSRVTQVKAAALARLREILTEEA